MKQITVFILLIVGVVGVILGMAFYPDQLLFGMLTLVVLLFLWHFSKHLTGKK